MPRITTQTRLLGLLGLLVVLFGGTYGGLWIAHRRQAERMLANLHRDRSELLDSLLALTGESLKNFAHDYTYWDEMIRFVEAPDRAWGDANIEVSLATFRAHAAWVLRPDGSQVYGAVRGIDPSFTTLPLPADTLLARLQRERFAHFFHRSVAGVLEIRTAPIQPTEDQARTSPAQGWFVVARLWDEAHLAALQRAFGGTLALDFNAAAVPPADRMLVRLRRPLAGLDGRAVAELRAEHFPQSLALLLRENENQKLIFAAFGGAIVAFAAFGISRWAIRPLRRLEQSMAHGSPVHLGELTREPDTFGRLAALIESSFDQRRTLEREIEERRRMEAALRRSEAELRNSYELRTRLARDLHDGVIQSIYAAGLGLEGMRGALLSDPAAAERRLNAAQASLNQTIREVRSFIQGLEPDEGERLDFARALQSLVTTLQSLHPVEIPLRIELAPLRLSPREEVHALQIVRECVSNAIRHGQAARIEVSLRKTDAGAELTVRDNGRGFDLAAARTRGGSGLANLASRAAEIAAHLEIDSSPGKGTGVTLRFSQR